LKSFFFLFEASYDDLVARLGENSLIRDIDPLTLTKVLKKTNPELASDAFKDDDIQEIIRSSTKYSKVPLGMGAPLLADYGMWLPLLSFFRPTRERGIISSFFCGVVIEALQKRALQDKNQTLQTKNQTLQTTNQTLQTTNQTLQTTNQTVITKTGNVPFLLITAISFFLTHFLFSSGFGVFLDRKLHPIRRGQGESKPSKSRDHAPATALEEKKPPNGTFKVIKNLPRNEVSDSLLNELDQTERVLIYDNEAAGLNMRTSPEYFIPSDYPDVVFVLGEEGIPVGVVEVKVPDKDLNSTAGISSESVAGQLFDYLRILYQAYGVEHPFGIQTSYQHWRICWLPKSDPIAAQDEVFINPGVTSIPRRAFKESHIPSKAEVNDVLFEETKIEIEDVKVRVLHGTRIFRFDDRELPTYLVSTLMKMAAVTIRPRPMIKDQHYLTAGDRFQWAALSNNPRHDKFPGHNTKNFFFLRELGRGAEGNAWLCCNESGYLCALKIFRRPRTSDQELETRIKSELEVWGKVWNLEAFRCTVLGRPALVMQQVLIAPEDGQGLTGSLKKAVKDAVHKLAFEGSFHHQDLEWRHVGFYKETATVIKAVLIDLYGTTLKSKKEQEEAEAEMLKKLGL